MKRFSLLVAGALLALGSSANAAIVNFDDLYPSTPNFGLIPDNYGSVAPVTVSYSSLNPSDESVAANNMEFWHSGYGDLLNVAYSSANSWLACVTLTPDAGYSVTLNAFDMAGYNVLDHEGVAVIKIVDLSGNILLDLTGTTIKGSNGTHSHFEPNLTSDTGIRIIWGPDWNTGIDNIEYSAQRSVPEPASLGLVGMGAAGLLLRRRRNA